MLYCGLVLLILCCFTIHVMLWVGVANIMLFYYSCNTVGWCYQYYAVSLFMLCCRLVLLIVCCSTIHFTLYVGATTILKKSENATPELFAIYIQNGASQ